MIRHSKLTLLDGKIQSVITTIRDSLISQAFQSDDQGLAIDEATNVTSIGLGTLDITPLLNQTATSLSGPYITLFFNTSGVCGMLLKSFRQNDIMLGEESPYYLNWRAFINNTSWEDGTYAIIYLTARVNGSNKSYMLAMVVDSGVKSLKIIQTTSTALAPTNHIGTAMDPSSLGPIISTLIEPNIDAISLIVEEAIEEIVRPAIAAAVTDIYNNVSKRFCTR